MTGTYKVIFSSKEGGILLKLVESLLIMRSGPDNTPLFIHLHQFVTSIY